MKDYLQRLLAARIGRPIVGRAHEDAGGAEGGGEGGPDAGAEPEAGGGGAVDPNDIQLIDERGHAIDTPEGDERVTRAHASQATLNAYNQTLSAFVLGYPNENLDDLILFLAPEVQAPLMFRYRVKSLANAYAIMQDTGFGINGRPQLVRLGKDSQVLAQLQSHGLMSYLEQDEIDLAEADPQWGPDGEVQDRIGDLRNMDRRGTLKRILALFASAAASGSKAKTWNAAADPMKDLQDEVETLATEVGSLSAVRMVLGSTAWKTIYQHGTLTGDGSTVPKRVVTLKDIANSLGIPEKNIRVSRQQAVNTKQGVTATKSKIFTANHIYLFGAFQNASRNDRSFVKRFRGNYRGQRMYAFRYGISTGQSEFRENFGFCYRELLSTTNSDAVQRLVISDGS